MLFGHVMSSFTYPTARGPQYNRVNFPSEPNSDNEVVKDTLQMVCKDRLRQLSSSCLRS
jgi:hypothetical protein